MSLVRKGITAAAQLSHQRYDLINIYIEWRSRGELIKSFGRYGRRRRLLGLLMRERVMSVASEQGVM